MPSFGPVVRRVVSRLTTGTRGGAAILYIGTNTFFAKLLSKFAVL